MILKELLDTSKNKNDNSDVSGLSTFLSTPLPKDNAKLPTLEDVENDSGWLEFVEA